MSGSPRRAVAACIVTHDDAEDVAPCLDSLAALAEPPHEVAIVDCASTDRSAEAARAWRGSLAVSVHALAENVGFAGGMNRAIAATQAPWVLSLNADARPERAFLSRLLDRAEAHPELRVGALTGRLLRFAAPGESDRLDACGMRLTWTWRHLDRGAGEPDRGQYGRAERVFGGTGAATLYRRAALADAALADGAFFDERFHSFREDAELAFRLHERGWETVYEPAARARHRRRNLPERRRAMPPAVNFHSLKNRYLLRLGHQSSANFLLTAIPATARDLLALFAVLVREPGSRRVYAWLWERRRELWRHRETLRARRTAPAAAVERWFWRSGEPL